MDNTLYNIIDSKGRKWLEYGDASAVIELASDLAEEDRLECSIETLQDAVELLKKYDTKVSNAGDDRDIL